MNILTFSFREISVVEQQLSNCATALSPQLSATNLATNGGTNHYHYHYHYWYHHPTNAPPSAQFLSFIMQAELVREMLAKYLIKKKKFDKYMNKVDKDESKTLSKKEWRHLLKKIKKKDHDANSWELTTHLASSTFKQVQACESNGGKKTKEIEFRTVRAWVFRDTKRTNVDIDIFSWGQETNREVPTCVQVVPIPMPCNS
jgi:hypothetical protein